MSETQQIIENQIITTTTIMNNQDIQDNNISKCKAYFRNTKNSIWIWKTAQVVNINIDFQKIKWKNERASKGVAYMPTEIEHLANVLTHGIWVIPAFFAWLQLIWRSRSSNQITVACIYGGSFFLLFLISTFFHSIFYIQKNRRLKDLLHRCDRAMIYIFIAGSYFPWLNLVTVSHSPIFNILKWCVWFLAVLGIIYQQIFHERFKCLETIFYLFIGLGPAFVVILSGIDFPGFVELKFGGFLYIIGICFFKSDGLIPCAHAIWHLFVVFAASVHYFATLKYLFPIHSSYP